jgi:hypothetical protein
MFVGSVAGGLLARDQMVLEAIAAETMPQTLLVSGVPTSPYFELRDYGDANVSATLDQHGIRAVSQENGRFLFAFDSLEARERAWREVRIDGAPLREIALYRSL